MNSRVLRTTYSCRTLLLVLLICSVAGHRISAALEAQAPEECASACEKQGDPAFRFEQVDSKSLALWERDRPVFVYNHGIISKAGVPADRNRSTYLHPVYGLDGEVLTDDFPKDHYHHRGIFWAWPHVLVGSEQFSLWDLRGVEQRFERWLVKQTGAHCAMLGIENGWYVRERKVAREAVWIRTENSTENGRCLDIRLVWIPLDQSLTLRGAEGKSYGGLTMRFAPSTNIVITTPLGQGSEDLHVTRMPWADFSANFAGRPAKSGAAIFISPDHPDYPPQWLTRHYGVLCVGWPGVEEKMFQPGEIVQAKYRIWIHRNAVSPEDVSQQYTRYLAGESRR